MLTNSRRFLSFAALGIAVIGSGFYSDRAVTTGIHDAYPSARWVQGFVRSTKPRSTSTFELTPGYYRVTIQSYCLHAGAYAPTSGDGYLLAPLKGDRSALIRSILQRSAQHPEIDQQDVQRLIWGIEADAGFNDYPADFQAKVSPLLAPGEMATMSAEKSVRSALDRYAPAGLQRALGFYGDLKRRVTDAQTSYQQLEQIAVKTGIAPEGAGSRRVDPGEWGYAGNDFYMRAYPEGYPTTTVEILLPACYRLQRDRQGRITEFESGEYRIEASYDELGSDSRVGRFRTLSFTGPNGSLAINSAGWVVSSDIAAFSGMHRAASGSEDRSRQAGIANKSESFAAYGKPSSAVSSEFEARIADARRQWGELEWYRAEWRRGAGYEDTRAAGDLTDLTHFAAGLAALRSVADSSGHRALFEEQMSRLFESLAYAECLVSGDCSAGGWGSDCSRVLDPSGVVATPGNTAQQRLGMSARLKNPQPRIP
ncbi:MAG TPA: hypothetical protein VEZ90_12190 [Blastocatellia bacterium]|nr:hypothetical protein [Blastocatellia bacterium]